MGELHQYIAITRGPIVLSRDERIGDPSLEAIITPLTDNNGYIELNYVKPLDPEIWMLFSTDFVPESYAEHGAEHVKVHLCDYASAGNTTSSFPFLKFGCPNYLTQEINL